MFFELIGKTARVDVALTIVQFQSGLFDTVEDFISFESVWIEVFECDQRLVEYFVQKVLGLFAHVIALLEIHIEYDV
jgi:hypothetical protein